MSDSTEAFQESDRAAGSSFFGLIDRRYLKSWTGALHALSSLTALVTGNWLFVDRIVLNHQPSLDDDGLCLVFFVSTALSGSTLLLFWNKVQSWQLSTTTMKAKGLAAGQMKNFNRGRGVLGMMLAGVYPLLYRTWPNEWLQSPWISSALAITVLSLCAYQYVLVKDYGQTVFLVYGGSKIGFSLQILLSGSLASMQQTWLYAIDYMEKEAILIVCCVEFGFLWYYLYSRRLVSKPFVQTACQHYHPVLLYTWMARMTADAWWQRLPLTISCIMAAFSLLTALFLYKLIKSLRVPLISSSETPVRRRRSSVFEVQDEKRRRSSVFEQIDIGLLVGDDEKQD